MKDVLQYKDFLGSVHFSAEDMVFYGRIEGIEDLITYEGKNVNEIQAVFREAVEDYMQLCKENSKPVHKSYKGSFNVRIRPDLHKKAVKKSLLKGISLNQLVAEALEKEVSEMR